MSDSFLYNIGKSLGPQYRRGKWMLKALTGSERDVVEAEAHVGRDLAEQILADAGRDNSPEAEHDRYVIRTIGRHLADCLTKERRTFRFEVVNDPQPNAFALPGGYVFFTRALLRLCEREDGSVAFVLGHEMGHIIKGHALDRLMQDTVLSAAMRVTPTRGLLSGWLKQVGVRFFQSGYSQGRELEADEFGTRLIAAGGYEPRDAIKLLQKLGQATGSAEEGTLSEYLATHPPANVRIEALAKKIRR